MDGDGIIALSIIGSAIVVLFIVVPAPHSVFVLAAVAAGIAVATQ